jgi:hypothetical protein
MDENHMENQASFKKYNIRQQIVYDIYYII